MQDPAIVRQNLGNRIRFLRHRRGWSQEELHRKSGLGRSFTGAVERGEMDIGTDTLYKLAKVFEMKLSELMEGIDDLVRRK